LGHPFGQPASQRAAGNDGAGLDQATFSVEEDRRGALRGQGLASVFGVEQARDVPVFVHDDVDEVGLGQEPHDLGRLRDGRARVDAGGVVGEEEEQHAGVALLCPLEGLSDGAAGAGAGVPLVAAAASLTYDEACVGRHGSENDDDEPDQLLQRDLPRASIACKKSDFKARLSSVSDTDLQGDLGESATSAKLRTALREARERVAQLEAENQALREELLSAGEMIETLAMDLERPAGD
jgi:hypothetical protein